MRGSSTDSSCACLATAYKVASLQESMDDVPGIGFGAVDRLARTAGEVGENKLVARSLDHPRR